MSYTRNNVARVSAVFRDSSGSLVDPSEVFFQYKLPSGSEVTLEYVADSLESDVKRSSEGSYYTDLVIEEEGVYEVGAFSTGVGMAAAERRLRVRKSRLTLEE